MFSLQMHRTDTSIPRTASFGVSCRLKLHPSTAASSPPLTGGLLGFQIEIPADPCPLSLEIKLRPSEV